MASSSPSVKVPPGVTAVFIHDGRVLATASDFDRSAPGGFTLREAQAMRAGRQLAIEVVKALASPALYENLCAYDCEQIVRKMKGTTITVNHGHADE